VSLAIWDQIVLPATRHKWTYPALTPAIQEGTRFTYPEGTEGWVDLVDLIAPRPGVEPATFRSRVQRPANAPPKQPPKLYNVRHVSSSWWIDVFMFVAKIRCKISLYSPSSVLTAGCWMDQFSPVISVFRFCSSWPSEQHPVASSMSCNHVLAGLPLGRLPHPYIILFCKHSLERRIMTCPKYMYLKLRFRLEQAPVDISCSILSLTILSKTSWPSTECAAFVSRRHCNSLAIKFPHCPAPRPY